MSDVFDILQERYQALVARQEGGETEEEFLEDARTFVSDARQAGAAVADLNQRSQLRAWMRFLANALYDATGIYPDTTLQPLARGQLVRPQPDREPRPPRPFSLPSMLAGGAAVAIIAAGVFAAGVFAALTATGWLSRPAEIPEEIPTPGPVPFVSYATVGAGLDSGGAVQAAADTFCQGTSEIVAEFALERVEPGTEWRWEVRRGADVVAAQPATPWDPESRRVTVRALTGGPEGVEPGQYDLRIYADGQLVGLRSFQVLETAPRVFNLQIADVPDPAGDASQARTFAPGVRVIYLAYEFEGFCPAIEVSHTLYQGEEPLHERALAWQGTPQGRAQLSFPAPGDGPLPPGRYEVAITIAGEEQERVEFAIEPPPSEPEAVSPAFGDVTIALGVQPDGTPIITSSENRFDWNTKVIYTIFDHVGMRDGLRWSAVWTREGQEVARKESFWDTKADGVEGTHWVTYQGERGQVLFGGTYSVTLTIDGTAQRTADFEIIYYVPPE